MIKYGNRSTLVMTRTIILVIMTTMLQSCSQWKMPENLIGHWGGMELVTTRCVGENGKFCFIDDSLPVIINIQRDGNVSGFVGRSGFVGCRVSENRGWFLRMLHWSTDFEIDGYLEGRFNTKDKDTLKEISVPFSIEESRLRGSIFKTNNSEMFPIVPYLRLNKELSPL
jgi:hypothetical protein